VLSLAICRWSCRSAVHVEICCSPDLFANLFAIPANSQLRAVPASVQQNAKNCRRARGDDNDSSNDPHRLLQQELVARAVADRQSQLRIDTEKLVALTAELKQHVDKAGANILSMDVIRRHRKSKAGQERSRQDAQRLLRRTPLVTPARRGIDA